MLELNYSFFVMLVNFLVLLFILNAILFKPVMQMFKEREDTIKGNLDSAKDLQEKSEEGIARLNRELAESRSKAKEIFEALRAEGVNRQREVLSATKASADASLEQAKQEIRSEAEKARRSLQVDVDKFSDEIVRKLVKV